MLSLSLYVAALKLLRERRRLIGPSTQNVVVVQLQHQPRFRILLLRAQTLLLILRHLLQLRFHHPTFISPLSFSPSLPTSPTAMSPLFLLPSAIASVETLNTNVVPSLFNPKLPPRTLSSSKKFESSSDLVRLRYHMGPILSSNPISIYIIWYGRWALLQKLLIKNFLLSISTTDAPSPSVAQWWCTVSLYTDQTGANVSRSVVVTGEHADFKYSHGNHLTSLSV